jgi:uncharacterized membrane protein YkoI
MQPFCGSSPERHLKGPFISRSDNSRDNAAMKSGLYSSTIAHPLAAVLLAAAMTTPLAVRADKGDHERARQAVQAGEVLPLPVLLERLQREQPGQVLEVELEQAKGSRQWIYEIRLLKTGGGLVKLKLDARTGTVMAGGERLRDQDRKPDGGGPSRPR